MAAASFQCMARRWTTPRFAASTAACPTFDRGHLAQPATAILRVAQTAVAHTLHTCPAAGGLPGATGPVADGTKTASKETVQCARHDAALTQVGEGSEAAWAL